MHQANIFKFHDEFLCEVLYIYIEVSTFLKFGSPALIFKLKEPFSSYQTMPFVLKEPETVSLLKIKAGELDTVPVMPFSQ